MGYIIKLYTSKFEDAIDIAQAIYYSRQQGERYLGICTHGEWRAGVGIQVEFVEKCYLIFYQKEKK